MSMLTPPSRKRNASRDPPGAPAMGVRQPFYPPPFAEDFDNPEHDAAPFRAAQEALFGASEDMRQAEEEAAIAAEEEEVAQLQAQAQELEAEEVLYEPVLVEPLRIKPVGVGMTRMPFYADREMQDTYYNFCLGEYPTAECLSKLWGTSVKASSTLKDAVWIFSHRTSLWETTPLFVLRDNVHKHLSSELDSLGSYVIRECAKQKKGALKTLWTNVKRRVEVTSQAYHSGRGLDAVVKILVVKLYDESFAESLDNARDILSCANGVLNLRTLELVPRTAAHKLSYALPTPYDPAASTADIREYIANLYEDAETENAFQVLAGYYATGETTVKKMWQWSCISQGGKTSLLEVLCGPLGNYALRGVVPAKELEAGHLFQDRLADALESHPKPRLISVDELKPHFPLAEELVNQLTDGTTDQRVQLGRKGLKHNIARESHTKLVLCSNHVIQIPAGATGLSLRNTGIGLRFQFLEAPNPHALLERPQNPLLKKRLLDPANFAGTLLWMVLGSRKYYAGDSLMCLRFEESSFDLRVRGDPYLAWLSDAYSPCDEAEEKVSYDDLVRAFRASGRSGTGSASAAWAGIKTMLDTMAGVLLPISWSLPHQPVLKGVSHLRERVLEDLPWAKAFYNLKTRGNVAGIELL